MKLQNIDYKGGKIIKRMPALENTVKRKADNVVLSNSSLS